MSFFISKKFTFTALTFTFECILIKNNDEMMTTWSQAG